jgi:nucleotide-binding universal stress UspA family protein
VKILVVPEAGARLDPSILVGQSLARWSGGQWRVLHSLGLNVGSVVRGRAQAERARRMVRLIARPELPPTRHRIALRSMRSAVREELAREDVDVVVTNADRASDGRRGGSLGELIEISDRPVLAVRDVFGAPPRRVSIVTEPRDIESNVLQAAVSWMLALLGPDPEHQTALPVQVDLVHVAMTRLDWSVAQFRFAEQSEQGLGQPHVVVRGARPEFPAHIPETLGRMDPDLVIVFQDERGGKQGHRFGRLARRIIQRSPYPVLLLPPAPLQENRRGHHSAESDQTGPASPETEADSNSAALAS